VTQIVETCARSRTIFEACGGSAYHACSAGANAGKTPPVSWTGVHWRKRSGLGPGNVVSSTPAVPRPRSFASVPDFSGLRIVMGRPWHDIRIVTDAGGHWRNFSSELPASVSKWAKSYNSSRNLPPTGQPVSFKRPARYTRAFSRRRPPVSRQSKMTILRPDFFSRKPFLQS
jgi:hypothetical protein